MNKLITVRNEATYQLQGRHYGKGAWRDIPSQVYTTLHEARRMKWLGSGLCVGTDDEWLWISDLETRIVRRVQQTTSVDVVCD
jgi:hypothetical protein